MMRVVLGVLLLVAVGCKPTPTTTPPKEQPPEVKTQEQPKPKGAVGFN